jgi:hypothetical protein
MSPFAVGGSEGEFADLLEWIGGEFNPEEFDAKTATMAMVKTVRRSV